MSNFLKVIPLILRNEGGYVNNPKDPGGDTSFGVSLRFLKGTNNLVYDFDNDGDIDAVDIKRMSKDNAITIYKNEFWDKYNFDRFDENACLQYTLFDMIVNSGPGGGFKVLQNTLGIKADGVFGPVSLKAYNDVQDKSQLHIKYQLERKKFYADLIKRKPDLSVFIKGWNNRVDNVTKDFEHIV